MPEETEQETRKRRIDPKLEAIGWKLIKYHESKSVSSYLSHAIEEYPTSNGPVDYALVDQDQIIALVEAKKLGTDPQNVLVQAQRYAQGVKEPTFDFDEFRVPFIYYSQRFQKGDFEDGEAFNPQVLPNSYLTDPQPGHAFVYVCTIQRMRVNLFGWQNSFEATDQDTDDESDATQVDIPIHAFDLIIADECHRGYSAQEISKWREVLDYFDSIKIGLTATPAAHTTAYFKDIVFRYEYERAVREGYLVDWDAVRIKSDVRINGIFLNEGETVGLIDTETGQESLDTLEDEREFDTSEIERKVTSPDSNRKIVEEIAKYAQEHERIYGHFPKTLIFGANDLQHTSHCDTLVDICRDVFGQGDAFVQKITGSPNVDRPLQRIREFRNRPNPGIVVTRDMLTTGVDIPALEFLVFLRPVKSRILWEQMLGRGTRLCDEINKTHFTVFDCFNGGLFEYFKNVTAFELEPPTKATRTYAELIDDIYQNRDRKYNVKSLVKRLQRIEKELGGEAREKFAYFIPDGDMRSFARDLPQRIENDFVNVLNLLRTPEFQDLLVNYPRPKRGFIVTYETQDEVSSEWLLRQHDGTLWKPEDYLVAFSRYVKENPEHIEAIEILLDRPADWNTEALSELRIKAGTTFTDNQMQWLERIRAHLIANLTIDKADFDTLPIFQCEGGWNEERMGTVTEVFRGEAINVVTAEDIEGWKERCNGF